MKAYNLYYNNKRLNTNPINKETLESEILNKEFIYKQSDISKELIKLSTKNIKIVETTIV